MRAMRSRIAVLASGGGSNLQAILEHFEWLGERRGGDVVLVASDRPNAGVLERAARAEIDTAVLSTDKRPGGASLDDVIDTREIDLIVLAGYLRLVPAEVVGKYEGRIIN